MPSKQYRLVTRSDFDGLVCGMLLREVDLINEIKFVHPKDMQDGKVEISNEDITTNLPYIASCHLAFDHHSSELSRNSGDTAGNHIIDPNAPSAARVVYDYYGGRGVFGRISEELMAAVDKGDSARFSASEIEAPAGWVLLNFMMDSRTGLGRFRNFRVSNYQLMMDLIEYCRDHSIDQILELPDVRERVDLFMAHQGPFEDQIKRCAKVHGKLAVLDLRNEEIIYAGNRFMIYALFPQCNISIHVMWGLKQQNTVLAIGKSILDRSCELNVGALCLQYGGGGHDAAGTCQIGNDGADATIAEVIGKITG